MNTKILDTEIAGAPHFVQHHLCVRCVHYFRYSSLGDPENVVLLVVGADAGHLFEGIIPVGRTYGHITSTDSLLTIHPQLTEVDGASVEIGYFGDQ